MAWYEVIGSGIASLLTSAGSGGVLGLIGSIWTGWLKGRKQEAELKLNQQRFEHRLALLKIKAEQITQAGSWEGLARSIEAESVVSEKVSPWVANVKSLWRPLLTLVLILLSGMIFYRMTTGPDLGYITNEERTQIIEYMIRTIIFTTATAVTWWFGDRALQPPRST